MLGSTPLATNPLMAPGTLPQLPAPISFSAIIEYTIRPEATIETDIGSVAQIETQLATTAVLFEIGVET